MFSVSGVHNASFSRDEEKKIASCTTIVLYAVGALAIITGLVLTTITILGIADILPMGMNLTGISGGLAVFSLILSLCFIGAACTNGKEPKQKEEEPDPVFAASMLNLKLVPLQRKLQDYRNNPNSFDAVKLDSLLKDVQEMEHLLAKHIAFLKLKRMDTSEAEKHLVSLLFVERQISQSR